MRLCLRHCIAGLWSEVLLHVIDQYRNMCQSSKIILHMKCRVLCERNRGNKTRMEYNVDEGVRRGAAHLTCSDKAYAETFHAQHAVYRGIILAIRWLIVVKMFWVSR
jgi:hypothetical protein